MEQVKEVVDNVHSMGGYAAPLREVAINLVIGYELQDLCMCEQVYVCVCMEMWYLTHTHTPQELRYTISSCVKNRRERICMPVGLGYTEQWLSLRLENRLVGETYHCTVF